MLPVRRIEDVQRVGVRLPVRQAFHQTALGQGFSSQEARHEGETLAGDHRFHQRQGIAEPPDRGYLHGDGLFVPGQAPEIALCREGIGQAVRRLQIIRMIHTAVPVEIGWRRDQTAAHGGQAAPPKG